jgi:hypothetical protein
MAADSSTSVQFVVTATQTITNDDYRAAADGNLSAVGEAPAVTFVGQPVTGKPYYYFGSQRVAMRKGGGILLPRRPSDTDSTDCTDRSDRVPCNLCNPWSPCLPP